MWALLDHLADGDRRLALAAEEGVLVVQRGDLGVQRALELTVGGGATASGPRAVTVVVEPWAQPVLDPPADAVRLRVTD